MTRVRLPRPFRSVCVYHSVRSYSVCALNMDEMANNKDEEADEELLSQLKLFNEINKERSSFRHRFCRVWKSLKLRSALGHFGLMVSLSIYCVVGGVVSICSTFNSLYC